MPWMRPCRSATTARRSSKPKMPPYRSAGSDVVSNTRLMAACNPATGSESGSGMPPPRLMGDACSVREKTIERPCVPASVALMAGSTAAERASSSVTSCPSQCLAAIAALVLTLVWVMAILQRAVSL